MFNDQLKAGDVCLIVGAVNCPENIGKMCTLKQHLAPGESVTTPSGYYGRFVSPASEAWLIEGEGVFSKTTFYDGDTVKEKGWCIAPPQHLMKIDGHKEPEANGEKLVQKA